MSIIEVILVVVVIGVMASFAIPVFTDVRGGVKGAKLDSEVSVINAAVKTYLANGGTIGSDATAVEVIDQLKSRVADDNAETFVGMTGSFIDPRITPVPLAGAEVGSAVDRVIWDPAESRFKITNAAVSGIGAFTLSEPDAVVADADRSSVVRYASETNWVWDYEDKAAPEGLSPSEIPTTPGVTDSTPGPGAPPTGPPSAGPLALLPPSLTKTPGLYPLGNFSLPVGLVNSNPAGSSLLFYRLNGGNWARYEGGSNLMLEPSDLVEAYALPVDSTKYLMSSSISGLYKAMAERLKLQIGTQSQSVTYFDLIDENLTFDMEVTNLGDFPDDIKTPGFFETYWSADELDPRVAGTLAGSYRLGYRGDSAPLSPGLWGDEASLTLKAYAKANDTSVVQDSAVSQTQITAQTSVLPTPVITVQEQPDGSQLVTMAHGGRIPDGAPIYYSTQGDAPSYSAENVVLNGIEYTSPFIWNPTTDDAVSDDGGNIDIFRDEGNVAITELVLKSRGRTIRQTESHDYEVLETPGVDQTRGNEVVDSSRNRITLESITISQGGRTIVADNVNVLEMRVSNFNIPRSADENDIRVILGGKEEADLEDLFDDDDDDDDRDDNDFRKALEKAFRSTNLRDYVDYSVNARYSLQATDHDFDVSFSPLTNNDFLVVMERYGNSTFDLRPLDAAGNLIAGGNRLTFREYAWNSGYAPSDTGNQAFFFSVIDISKFGVNTDANSIVGFRVNNDGGADFKFFTISDESFEDREVRYTGVFQARAFPPPSLRVWFDPSEASSADVSGTFQAR